MPEQSSPHQGLTGFLAAIAMIVGLMIWLYFDGSKPANTQQLPTTQQATLLPELRPLKPFSLTDHNGKPFDNQSLLEHWTFMSFGYTYCPDICPTTMSLFSEMDDLLKRHNGTAPYQITFISIDPQRDSLERLSEYVTYFNPEFLGATGEKPALQKLTKPLGILYERVATEDSAMGYVMDHSASIILVDPQGQFHAYFGPPHDAKMMADDFLTISELAKKAGD